MSEALARDVQNHREGSLITALGKALFEQFGISVPAGAWPSAQLPDRLKMRVAVVDGKQKILSVSRDIRDLRDTALAERETAALDRLRGQWERSSLSKWGVGDLPERLPLEWEGRGVGYAIRAWRSETARSP